MLTHTTKKSCLLLVMPTALTGQVTRPEWSAGKEVSKFQGQLEVYLAKFQDPAQSDSMSRLQNDLDETKIILVSSIHSLKVLLRSSQCCGSESVRILNFL
jgi:hypothetical protein